MKLIKANCSFHSSPKDIYTVKIQGCHSHGNVMEFLEFLNFPEFLEKSCNFDEASI